MILDTSVRTGGDYGVVVSVPDVPETLGFLGSQVTFWGTPADPRHDNARQECLLDTFHVLSGDDLSGKRKAATVLDHADVL